MLIRRGVGVLVLLGVLALLVLGLREAEHRVFGGGSSPGAEVTVTIPRGASIGEIGTILAKAKVVDSASRFELEAFGSSGLQPGTYVLRVHDGYDRAITALEAGPPPRPTKKLVIPEGLAARDIAQLTPKVGLSGADYEAAVKRAKPPEGFLQGSEKAATMEGFLFPATYDVQQPPTGDELVGQQLAAFTNNFDQVDLTKAKKKNLTPYDVLKIASMIEREAVYPPDRRKIAAVIYNRLKAKMPLGIDATIQYAVGSWEPLKASDLDIDSPFNSRKVRGLPPTPIAAPGLASLQAAADPANVDYLYYVAIPGDPQHKHFFTKSFDEFLQFQKDHPA
jgi:uncharacterized YceG family protein